MANSKKIHLSNFTGSSISVTGGPGRAKEAKGFGTKMTKSLHERRGLKVASTKKGEPSKLYEGPPKSFKGRKVAHTIGKGSSGAEAPSMRPIKRPKKSK